MISLLDSIAPLNCPRVFVSSSQELAQHLLSADDCVFVLTDSAHVSVSTGQPITLFVNGDSNVSLEFRGEARPSLVCGGHAVLRIAAAASSSPKIRIGSFAEMRLTALGASRPEVVAQDCARIQILARENSRPHLEATDFAIPFVVVQDQARPHCSDWPVGWEARSSDIYVGQQLVLFDTEEDAIGTVHTLYHEWLKCRNRYIACIRTAGAVPRICPDVVDFRWKEGTIHLELPGAENPCAWYSVDAHHLDALTESQRQLCTRRYLK